MRFSNILFALPLAHSAIAAPLLGGLLSGLLGGGVSSPSTAGGDKAGKALDIVTKLGDSITGAFNGAGGDSLDFNNIDQVSGLLTKVTEVLEDATEKLGALKNPKTKRDFDDEEAAEVNAEGLAQIVDSIEDIVTKISEDLEANDIIERLLTTIDNNLFLVLEAVEAIVPGTLDRIDKYLKTVGGILDSSLVRVQQILDGLSLLG